MCVCVSLCNHTAWQMTKPVWWQCTHNLLLGSPTCCKNEAAPVLTMQGRLGITTDRPGIGPFWQPGTHECKLGAGREQLPAAEIERVCVEDCSGTHRPLLQPHLPRCHDHHPLPVPSMSAELRDAFRGEFCLFTLLQSPVGPFLLLQTFTPQQRSLCFQEHDWRHTDLNLPMT